MTWGRHHIAKFGIFVSGACLVLFLFACESRRQPAQQLDDNTLRESMHDVNKILIEQERQEIDDFIMRYGWPAQETGSGLRYYVYEQGSGRAASKGDYVHLEYSISLLNGDLIYSSNELGPRKFLIGRGGVESGLEEGILLLHEGDRAKFIMPAHLAHGVPGDGVRIPARAVIVYDVHLLLIEPNNR